MQWCNFAKACGPVTKILANPMKAGKAGMDSDVQWLQSAWALLTINTVNHHQISQMKRKQTFTTTFNFAFHNSYQI